MSDINVNTSTVNEVTANSSEPIVKSGGDNHTSFDDLERVMSTKKSGKSEDNSKKEGKENGKSEEKAKTKEKEVKDSEVKKDKSESSEKVKEDATAARTYKAKYQDKDLDLNADTIFEHKVNGQKVQVKLDELLANYSGKTDWDRKYSTLDTERKSFHTERDTLTSALNKVYELTSKENNPRGAIEFLAELMGADPLKVWNDFTAQVHGNLDELTKLTPEERAAKLRDQELDYYRKRDQGKNQEKQFQQVRDQIKSRVDQVQQKGNIDDATFYKLYNEIASTGKIAKDDITPELVGEYHKQVSMQNDIEKAIEESGIDPANKQKVFDELLQVWMATPGLKISDLKEIASEVYGGKSAKNLSNKVKKTDPSNTALPPKSRRHDPLTFDDLIEN